MLGQNAGSGAGAEPTAADHCGGKVWIELGNVFLQMCKRRANCFRDVTAGEFGGAPYVDQLQPRIIGELMMEFVDGHLSHGGDSFASRVPGRQGSLSRFRCRRARGAEQIRPPRPRLRRREVSAILEGSRFRPKRRIARQARYWAHQEHAHYQRLPPVERPEPHIPLSAAC